MSRLLLFGLMVVQAFSGCNVIDPRPSPAMAAMRPDQEEAAATIARSPAPVTARPPANPPVQAAPPGSPSAPPPRVEAPAEPDPYTLYGVAWQLEAQIRAAPEPASLLTGYLRRGAQFRAKPRASRQGCSRGWHEITGGGFVCDGDGVRISAAPVAFEPAAAPARRYDSLPYSYVMVSKEDTPAFYRVPAADEERVAESLLEGGPAVAPAVAPTPPAPLPEATTQQEPEADPEAALTGSELETAVEPSPAPNIPPPASLPPLLSVVDGATGSAQAGPAAERAPEARTEDGRELPEYVSARLTKGFYLSIDGRVHAENGRRFVRTVRGRFVSAVRVWHTRSPDLRGAVIDESMPLPVAFMKKNVQSLRWNRETSRLVAARLIPRLAAFHIRDVAHYRGSEYLRINGDRLVRPEWVVRVDRAEPPRGTRPDEKWIDVDLWNQTLTAYEGDRPVFVTLVSSGRAGFETPPGTYRIQSKHVTATMDDTTNPDGAYSIEDVPWTMYFQEGLALHAAFWHDRFGEPRSHGCINLSPADARTLFDWTLPEVPAAWHGAFASRDRPGTRIVIRR
ncbi:MAG: L,D-transpeptidase [Deltaproteobacteria bacterium]|nr:L,D-transpeptidase [Deltaproteobacteria bacterium]